MEEYAESVQQNKNDYNRENIAAADFINEFNKTLTLKVKKYLLKLLLESEPEIKISKLLNKINTLTDKKRLILYYSEINKNSSLVKKFSVFSKQTGLDSKIKKEAQKIFSKITTNKRKGRKFDGIVLGELSAYLNSNDQYVVNEIVEKLNNMPRYSSIKKIYSGFINNISLSVRIINSIKNNGIKTENIKNNLISNKINLLKEGMRTVFLNIVSLDKSFGKYIPKIKEILKEFKRDTTNDEIDEYDLSVLNGLENEKNIEVFADKAAKLLNDNIEYYDLINERYENILNEPLITIYSILKFPINREYFKEWIINTPILYNFSKNIENKIEHKKNEIEKVELQPPVNYEDLIRIIYNFEVCFTNKYKTISEVSKKYSKAEYLKYCLSNIKDVQFKIENSFINILISKIKNVFSRQELEQIFEKINKKIESHIKDYKELFSKNIDKYFKSGNQKLNKLGRLLKNNINDEKFINTETIIEFNRLMTTRKKLLKMMKVSNFFVAYYLTLNCRLILKIIEKYFNFIFKAENVFMNNKLSNSTKEEIYGFCVQYRKEKEFQIEKLQEYIKWGEEEKTIRERLLSKLKVHLKDDFVLKVNKFRIYSTKYQNNFKIEIRDKNRETRFRREIKSINSYPDFINSIQKVSDLIALNSAQFKILYQYAHLNTIMELLDYIDFKIRLLKDSILNTPVFKIKEEYRKSKKGNDYIKSIIEKCKKEIEEREKYRLNLLSEQSENDDPEILKRIESEINGQIECNQRIRKYLQEIDNIKEKRGDTESNVEKKVSEKIINKNTETENKLEVKKESNKINDEQYEKNEEEMIVTEDLNIRKNKIEDRSEKVIFNADEIFKTLEGKNENEQASILIKKLEQIEDREVKMDTASMMMIKSETKLIIDKTKELLENTKIDKYKMLLALYNVLDSKKDYELKIKILDEFCRYLEEKQPEVYIQLKYLLQIQREKIMQEKVLRGKKVSEIWNSINEIQNVEEKIEYLNSLLSDENWKNHHSVIKSIINGFITTDIKELFKKTDEIPVEEQLNVLNRIKEYRDDLNNEEAAKEILEKTLELNARRQFITNPGKRVFKADSLDLLTIAGKESDILRKSIDLAVLEAEQETVIEELKKNNAPDELIIKFRNSLDERKKAIDIYKGEIKKSSKIRIPEINSLNDAKKHLGYADSPEEQVLIGELEGILKENKISDANDFIRTRVYWECAKDKDYKKMTRLLSTIEENELIKHSKELKDEVDNYIQSMESVIIETAKHDTEELRKKASEDNIEVEVYNIKLEEKSEEISIDNIIDEFSNLVYFKDPVTVAEENGLTGDEIKKLPGLIEKYEHEGKFIYLPVHNEVLGTGKLKFIIEKAYLEYTQNHPIDIDISKLKEAWDIVRMQKELIYQYDMLGVSNKEERNNLYQKLQILIKPVGAKMSRPVKKQAVKESDNVQEKEQKIIRQRTVKKKGFSPNKKNTRKKENIKIKKQKKSNLRKEYNVKMKHLVEKSYAPIITDYVKNMFKGKKRKDFVMVAEGKKKYYTKEILQGVIEQILKRDFKGKSHSMLLDSVKQDKALFECILKELFVKEKTKSGLLAYFPKCLKK